MSETPLASYIEQFNALFKELGLLRPRFMAMLKSTFATSLPDDLALLKDRLMDESSPDGGSKRAGLFYRIGAILTREDRPLSMGELSEVLNTPLSTTTRMADWLVESGFVERVADPEDRRIVRIALTETGREMYHRIDEFIKERIAQTFSSITLEEWAGLVAMLRRLVNILDEVL